MHEQRASALHACLQSNLHPFLSCDQLRSAPGTDISLLSIADEATGTQVTLSLSKPTSKVIMVSSTASPTGAVPSLPSLPSVPSGVLEVLDSFTVVAEQEYKVSVTGDPGVSITIPSGTLAPGIQVSAAIVPNPEGASAPSGASMSSKVLSLLFGGQVSKSVSVVLPRTGSGRRQQAGMVTRMHWLNKNEAKWIETCGEHTPSQGGDAVLAVVEPSVLNDPKWNPSSGCTLCDGTGGLLSLFDIQETASSCNAPADTPAPSTDSGSGSSGGAAAAGGAVATILVVGVAAWFYIRRSKAAKASKLVSPEDLPGAASHVPPSTRCLPPVPPLGTRGMRNSLVPDSADPVQSLAQTESDGTVEAGGSNFGTPRYHRDSGTTGDADASSRQEARRPSSELIECKVEGAKRVGVNVIDRVLS